MENIEHGSPALTPTRSPIVQRPPKTGFVRLNVGGRLFATSVETLTRLTGTYFSVFFGGGYSSLTDETGCLFIDRDGDLFRYILNYLRSGAIHVSNEDLLKEIKDEALFFQVIPLVHLIEEKIDAIQMEKEQKRLHQVSKAQASKGIMELAPRLEMLSKFVDPSKTPESASPQKAAATGASLPHREYCTVPHSKDRAIATSQMPPPQCCTSRPSSAGSP